MPILKSQKARFSGWGNRRLQLAIKDDREDVLMQQQDFIQVLKDPLAQELMQSNIPARLAYVGADGFPCDPDWLPLERS